MAWAPGNRVVTGSEDGSLRLWDAQVGWWWGWVEGVGGRAAVPALEIVGSCWYSGFKRSEAVFVFPYCPPCHRRTLRQHARCTLRPGERNPNHTFNTWTDPSVTTHWYSASLRGRVDRPLLAAFVFRLFCT